MPPQTSQKYDEDVAKRNRMQATEAFGYTPCPCDRAHILFVIVAKRDNGGAEAGTSTALAELGLAEPKELSCLLVSWLKTPKATHEVFETSWSLPRIYLMLYTNICKSSICVCQTR